MNLSVLKKMAFTATLLALLVVLLGAFTRLSHAGLGCPDWPGCYGFAHIPTSSNDIVQANQAFPDQPYELAKAWPEMVHRYFATSLGLLVLILAILSFRHRNRPAFKYLLGLLLLVAFQGALGRWTVTLKLHPGIVMSHLAGGLTTLSLLAALTFRFYTEFKVLISSSEFKQFKGLIYFSLVVLVTQILLGGWTSANYAATVCVDLPICQGDWFVNSDFESGFIFWGHDVETYQYGILDSAGRIAIHASHRMGAIITAIVLCFLSYQLIFSSKSHLLKRFGYIISFLVLVQVSLGIINIIYQLPLYNAVAHNGVGALLLLVLSLLLTSFIQSDPRKLVAMENDND